MNKRLLPDHGVVLVIGVVGVAQLAVRTELELEKLVAKLTLVADIVAQVEVIAHGGAFRLSEISKINVLAELS